MSSNRWETRIEAGANYTSTKWDYIYGATLEHLLSMARFRLTRTKPLYFTNGGDHIAGIYRYYYVDEAKAHLDFLKPEYRNLEEGWWYDRQDMTREYTLYHEKEHVPVRLGSFETAIEHFLRWAIIPEKGPGYQSKALLEKQLHLPLIEKILRENADHPVNDLIQRGWHIIALEYDGEASTTGELMNRKAVFVMGHPESQAALLTINSMYYRRRVARRQPEKTRRE